MICKNCKAPIPENSMFCPFCGQKGEAEPMVAPALAFRSSFQQAGSLDVDNPGFGAPVVERVQTAHQGNAGSPYSSGFNEKKQSAGAKKKYAIAASAILGVLVIGVLLFAILVLPNTASPEGLIDALENSNDQLLGAWYSVEEGVVLILDESGTAINYFAMLSPSEDEYATPFVLRQDATWSYRGNNNEQLELSSDNEIFIYDFNLQGDSLFFSNEEESFSFRKINKTTQSIDPLIGQWKLLKDTYHKSHHAAYNYQDHKVTFYPDGSFVSTDNDGLTTDGRYEIIRSGKCIEMNYSTRLISYWDFEILYESVMQVTDGCDQFLYIAQ